MADATSSLSPGFYWVRFHEGEASRTPWVVAELRRGAFLYAGVSYFYDDVETLGERISPPEPPVNPLIDGERFHPKFNGCRATLCATIGYGGSRMTDIIIGSQSFHVKNAALAAAIIGIDHEAVA